MKSYGSPQLVPATAKLITVTSTGEGRVEYQVLRSNGWFSRMICMAGGTISMHAEQGLSRIVTVGDCDGELSWR